MKKTLLFLSVFLAVSGYLYADGKSIFKSASKRVEYALEKGIYYNMELTDKKGKSVQKGIVYNKENKARMEFGDLTTIVNGDDMYIYNAGDKSAIKMSVRKETGQNTLESFDSTKIPENAVFIKTTSKNGYKCQLVKAKEDGMELEYYLTAEYGFPTCVKTSDGDEVNMTNFKYGVKDDKFELPAGTKISDISGFSGGTSSKKSNIIADMMKETANDTAVGGAKEGTNEAVSEQKSNLKESTKSKTKEGINKLFGF